MENRPDSYKYGSKNNWRRWQWNRICSRMEVPINKARVLYLVGPGNQDYRIAKEHGLRSSNLFSVTDDEVIRGKTQCGISTITGNLGDIIYNWPEYMCLHAIIADFCSGWTRKGSDNFMRAMWISRARYPFGTVVSLTMWRGRDEVNKLRVQDWSNSGTKITHRGILFIRALGFNMWEKLHQGNETFSKLTFQEQAEYMLNFNNSVLRPEYFSYRTQNGKFMDTVIFTTPTIMPSQLEEIREKSNQKFPNIQGKIAAMKAWRTMRYGNWRGEVKDEKTNPRKSSSVA